MATEEREKEGVKARGQRICLERRERVGVKERGKGNRQGEEGNV